MTFKADLLTLLQTADSTFVSKVISEEAQKIIPNLTHTVTSVFDGDTCEEDSIFVSCYGVDTDLRFSTQEVIVDKEGNYRVNDVFGDTYEFSSTMLEYIQEKHLNALPKSAWEDNAVQFPRLLSEIMATQDKINFESLAEAMNIEVKDVEKLFERAQQEWEKAKQQKG